MVTEEQLFKALIGQEEKGRLIGSILVSEGVLTEDDLFGTRVRYSGASLGYQLAAAFACV